MYLLYQRFVQQAKQEEYEKYNFKHRKYLVRTGKLPEQRNIGTALQQQQPVNHQRKPRERDFKKPRHQEVEREAISYPRMTQAEDQPIRGSQSYNINATDETQIFNQPQSRANNRKVIPKATVMARNERKQESVDYLKESRKQQNSGSNLDRAEREDPRRVNRQQPVELQEFAEIQLVECPENCGRKFNPKALPKHVKICQKGQQKRKVFKVKVVDGEAQKLKKVDPSINQKKESNLPKWKKESEELRNRIQNKQTVDDRKECRGCGRKFNENALDRHVSKCVERSTAINVRKR